MKEKTVRTWTEFKSMDELKLSPRTKSYLQNKFPSWEDLVCGARAEAYMQECSCTPISKQTKWKQELVTAMRDAGFIRPAEDFTMSFNVARLYKAAYSNKMLPDYVKFITDIAELTASGYENFRSLTEDDIRVVRAYLSSKFTDQEFEALCHIFNLNGGKMEDEKSLGRHLGISTTRARRLSTSVCRRLRHFSNKLPAIFYAPCEADGIVEDLYAELNALYESPAFVRAGEIAEELMSMRSLPFKYECDIVSEQASIDEINFSAPTHARLWRAGFRTVSDILNYPKEDWSRVRYIGQKGLAEITARMRAIGYTSFYI